jgi:hypothetical protein
MRGITDSVLESDPDKLFLTNFEGTHGEFRDAQNAWAEINERTGVPDWKLYQKFQDDLTGDLINHQKHALWNSYLIKRKTDGEPFFRNIRNGMAQIPINWDEEEQWFSEEAVKEVQEKNPISCEQFFDEIFEDLSGKWEYYDFEAALEMFETADRYGFTPVIITAAPVELADRVNKYDVPVLNWKSLQFGRNGDFESINVSDYLEGKQQIVREAQDHGVPVAYFGDGSNDVLALNYSDMGFYAGPKEDIPGNIQQIEGLDGGKPTGERATKIFLNDLKRDFKFKTTKSNPISIRSQSLLVFTLVPETVSDQVNLNDSL